MTAQPPPPPPPPTPLQSSPSPTGPEGPSCTTGAQQPLVQCYPVLDKIPGCAQLCLADAFLLQPCLSDDEACRCARFLDIQEKVVPCAQSRCGLPDVQLAVNNYLAFCKGQGWKVQSSLSTVSSTSDSPSPSPSLSIMSTSSIPSTTSTSASNTGSTLDSQISDTTSLGIQGSDPSDLPTNTIVGIAFGAFGAVLIVTLIAIFLFSALCRRRRRRFGSPLPSNSRDSLEDPSTRQIHQSLIPPPLHSPIPSATYSPFPSPTRPLMRTPSRIVSLPAQMPSSTVRDVHVPISPLSDSSRFTAPGPSPIPPPVPLRSPLRDRKVLSVEVPWGLYYGVRRDSSTLPSNGSPSTPSRQTNLAYPEVNLRSHDWQDDSFGGSMSNKSDISLTGGGEEDEPRGGAGNPNAWWHHTYPQVPTSESRNMI